MDHQRLVMQHLTSAGANKSVLKDFDYAFLLK